MVKLEQGDLTPLANVRQQFATVRHLPKVNINQTGQACSGLVVVRQASAKITLRQRI
jgi:hypothetical protein